MLLSLSALQNLSPLGSWSRPEHCDTVIFQGSTKQNFQTLQQILSQRQIDQYIC